MTGGWGHWNRRAGKRLPACGSSAEAGIDSDPFAPGTRRATLRTGREDSVRPGTFHHFRSDRAVCLNTALVMCRWPVRVWAVHAQTRQCPSGPCNRFGCMHPAVSQSVVKSTFLRAVHGDVAGREWLKRMPYRRDVPRGIADERPEDRNCDCEQDRTRSRGEARGITPRTRAGPCDDPKGGRTAWASPTRPRRRRS